MDIISVVIKNILPNVAGSLNTIIPKTAVPTAPIPVHTAYAVPMGKVCVAFTSNTILITNAIKKPKYHKTASLPVVSLALPRQNAKPVSNKPAITKTTQFI